MTDLEILHDINAEITLIGSVFLHNPAMDHLAWIAPDAFGDPFHQVLWDEMKRQWDENRSINHATIGRLIKTWPSGQKPGELLDYIKALPTRADISAIKAMARVVADYQRRRKLRSLSDDLKSWSQDLNIRVSDACSATVQELDDVLASIRSSDKTSSTINEIFRDALDSLTEDTSSNIITTGLKSLDYELGGWRRKQYAILAGRPSMGKTAIATSAMIRTAKAGIGVMFFSMEMPARDLAWRCLTDLAYSSVDRIPYMKASARNLTERERDTLGKAAGRFHELPIVIDEQRGLTIAELVARVRKQAQKWEREGISLGLVVVDYLGLVKASSRYAGNRVNEIGEISDGLATLAKSENVAVLALQQLNRAVESRDNKRPTLSDLRDSGNLEQDADVVCFAFREAYYLERTKFDAGSQQEVQRLAELEGRRNMLEVLIAKNRNGPTSSVNLFCDMACNAVRDLAS